MHLDAHYTYHGQTRHVATGGGTRQRGRRRRRRRYWPRRGGCLQSAATPSSGAACVLHLDRRIRVPHQGRRAPASADPGGEADQRQLALTEPRAVACGATRCDTWLVHTVHARTVVLPAGGTSCPAPQVRVYPWLRHGVHIKTDQSPLLAENEMKLHPARRWRQG